MSRHSAQTQRSAALEGGEATGGTAPVAKWTAIFAAMLLLVLVPFFIFEDSLTEFGAALLQSEARKPLLAILVAGLLASDVLLPVPSSLVSSFAGHLLGFSLGLVAVWSGMMLGCLVRPLPSGDRPFQPRHRRGLRGDRRTAAHRQNPY